MAAPALFAAATGGALCPFPGRIAAGGTPKRHLSYCFTRGAGELHSIWFCGTGEVHVRLFPRVFVALVCFVWLFLWAPCGRNGSRDRWQVGHKAVEQGGALYIYGAFWRLQASACQWGFEVGFLWEYGQLGLRGVPLHPPAFWFLFGNSPVQHVWEHFQLCCQTQTQVTAFRLYHRETKRKLNVICPLHSRSLPDQTVLIRAVRRAPEGRLVPAAMPSGLWRLPGDGLAQAQGFLCQAGFTLA